ncbi:MAG: HAMP domain-containing protein, partial [Chloroflexi bacterium]
EHQRWLAVAAPLTLPIRNRTWLVLAQREPPLAPLMDRLQTMLIGRFWLGLGLGLLAALFLALVTTRWIVRPLHQLATAARQVAQGDYQTEVPVEGPAEVHALAAEFNTMVRQVRASRDAQRDFVANVSHELKTPLTAIQGYAQAILDGAVEEPEAVRRAATIIYDEAGRMHRMVLQLLDLARLESGQVQMARRPVDLRALLGHVAHRFQPRAEEAGVALTTDLPPLPTIVGDGDWLVQLFSNLLDNALKHTPAGGWVRLSARLVSDRRPSRRGAPPPEWIEVAVADTGQGIPPEDLPRIFERFYQVDKSRRRTGSVGLGLAIAKEIAQAHGGTIRAESVQDVGSRFTVTLPVRLEA